MRIGFVGVGRMGGPMARHLVEAGHGVRVFDTARDAVDALVAAGAEAADSAGAAGEDAELILTALPSIAAVLGVYEELAMVARSGQVFADHSTVTLAVNRRCAELVSPAGFLDAPVSGGPEGAQRGTLTIMAGGDGAAYEIARPAFEAMGETVRLCGGPGAGTVVKLTNQLLVVLHNMAAAEAFVFGTGLGVEPQVLLDMIGPSYGGSTIFRRNLPRYIERDFRGAGPLFILTKDAAAVATEAEAAQIPLPFFSHARQVVMEAVNRGLAGEDMSALLKLFEEGAGTKE
jgi:3-hydroxyisobutyrate dehydrogenase-like beta-hydroxyacid dehydrogenase